MLTFSGTVGGSEALGNTTIGVAGLTVGAIKVQGTLGITNSAASSITGIISNGDTAAILTKAGDGTLTLSGDNTYTGATTVSAGILSITHADSLGATDGATTVASGASLQLSNAINVADAITISGTGISNNGAIRSTSGNNTLSGLITVAANMEIQTDADTLTLNVSSGNSITASNKNIILAGNGNTVVADPIAIGSGTLTKGGNGTVTLSGTNTYTGATTISNGVLIATNANSLGTTDGATTIADGAVLQISGGINIGDAINLTGTGEDLAGGIRSTSGNNTLSGLITLGGTSEIAADDDTLTLNVSSGAALTGTNRTIKFDGSGNITVNDPITTGSGVVNKGGSGTLTLSAANTYTGATNITMGYVAISNATGLGTTDGATTVASGATLKISGGITVAEAITLNGVGRSSSGAIAFTANDNTYSGAITLGSTSTIVSTGGAQTISGAVNGGQALTITANGNLIVSGAVGGSTDLSSYSVTTTNSSSQTFSANVETTGNQTYTAAGGIVTSGARTFDSSGGTVNFASALSGNNNVTVTGNADIDGAITDIAVLSISGTSNIGADITTSGTQTYTGAVTLSANVTLTSSGDVITFSNTVNSDGSTRNLTIATGGNSTEINFDGVVGGSAAVGAITITGALDLNAPIISATSLSVSGVSNLGANVTTSGTQTYLAATTLSGGARTLAGSTIQTVAVNGAQNLTITGNLDLNGAITQVAVFAVSGTTDLGANVTTTGTQTYSGAVTISGSTVTRTLTTSADTITFSNTLNSSASAGNHLTFGSNTGTATFTGAVGGATNGTLGTITNIASQTLIFSDAVTATTIANYGTLLFNATSAKTISSNITDNNTTVLQVINSADNAPEIITFSGNIVADTITIGTTVKAGSALFNGTVTHSGTSNINIVGGNVNAEDSLANFANTVTVTAITLDDRTGDATATFSGSSKTITGTINGVGTTEGTVTVTGTPTFASTIGNSNRTAQLTIGGATTFQAAVQTAALTTTAAISGGTTLNVSTTSNLGGNVTTSGAQTYTGAVTLSGGARTLQGSTITTQGTLAGGTQNLIITGNAVFGNGTADRITGVGTLSVSGNTTIHTDAITTSGTQTYGDATSDAIVIGTATTLTTSDDQITFKGTVNSEGSETNNLTLVVGTSEVEFDATVGGGRTLGAIAITGALDLDAVITNATSLSVSTTSNLGASVTTADTQTYTGAVTLSADVALTTTNNQFSFGSTVQSDGTARDLTLNSGNATITITGAIGGNSKPLDVLTITQSGGTTFSGVVNADTVTLTDTTGSVTFAGSVDLETLNTADQTYNVILNGDSNAITDAVTFSNTGYVTLVSGGDTSVFTGGVTAAIPSQINIGGTVQSTNTAIVLGASGSHVIVLTANSTISGNTSGAISLNGTVNGAYTLTLNSTAATTFAATVGNSAPLTAITTNSGGTVVFNTTAIETNGNQVYGENATLGGNITFTTGDNDLTFSGTLISDSTTRTLDIVAGSGAVTFSDAVGGSAALGNTTIGTAALDATAIKVQGTLAITNSGAGAITGIISNGSSAAIITKAGAGTLTLSGDNTYTGATTVSAGVLAITHADALGGTGGATTVADGAALNISGGITTAAEAITISGTGISSTGVIRNTSGNNTYSGAITLGANSEIQSDSGTLTLNVGLGSAIAASNKNLTFDGAGNVTVADRIATGSGTLTKTGNGTLTLSAANTYTGATTISDGTLAISNATGLGTTDAATTVASGGSLSISGGITVAEAITINGTGHSSGGAIIFTANNNTYSGAITLGATSTIVSTGGAQTISATTNGGNGLTITADGNLVISGIVGGSTELTTYAVTTTGSASQTFSANVTTSGNQTYTAAGGIVTSGARTFEGDTINFASALSGDNNVTVTGNADIDGAITDIAVLAISEASNISANITTSDTQTYTGAVTLSAAVTLTSSGDVITFSNTVNSADSTNRNLTVTTGGDTVHINFDGIVGQSKGLGAIALTGVLDLNAAIADANSLTVSGASLLDADVTTSGNQTYSGAITISGGARTLEGSTIQTSTIDAAISNTTNLTITGNLDLNGTIGHNTRPVIFSVSGTSNLGANVLSNGTQTYSGAVTLSANATLTSSNDNFTFSDAIDSDSSTRNLTLNPGSGTIAVSGAIGGEALGTLTITQSGGTTFGGRVTAATVTLTDTADDADISFNAGITIDTLNTTSEGYDINLYGATNTVTNDVTFSNTGTLKINDNSSLVTNFNGGVTATAPSSVTMQGTIRDQSGTGTITLGDSDTGLILIGNSTVGGTSTGNITLGAVTGSSHTLNLGVDGTSNTISVGGIVSLGTLNISTNSTATFTAAVGSSSALTNLNIKSGSTFNENVTSTNITINNAITGTFKKAITATAIVLDGGKLLLSEDNSVTIAGTINGNNTTEGTIQVTGATKTFSGIVGGSQPLTLVDIDDIAVFSANVSATTANLAATTTFAGDTTLTTLTVQSASYNVIFNGSSNTITNAANFQNTGTVTFGNASGDSSTFNGGLTTTAPSQINIGGTLQTSDDAMSLGDSDTPIVLVANTTLNTGSAALTVNTTVNGGYTLTLNSSAATTFKGIIGGSTKPTGITNKLRWNSSL